MPEASNLSRLNGRRAMRLKQIISYIVSQALNWLLWRVLLGATLALFALVALYQFTVAVMLVLESQVGALNAHLIVAGIFTAAALAVLATMVVTRPRRPVRERLENGITETRPIDIAMLVEALMLGLTVPRKKPRE